MAKTGNHTGLFAQLTTLARRILPDSLQMERDKAMNDLISRNNAHLLDDIGMSARNDNRQQENEENARRRPWLL